MAPDAAVLQRPSAAGRNRAPASPPTEPTTPNQPNRSNPPGRLAAIWARFDAAPQRRRVPGSMLVAAVGLIVGLGASWVSTRHGANLDYSDAQSHLTIARRIVESKAPGLSQLGTVWLPAPHLLLLPFVLNTWLWHTGWAACILGSLCLAASTSALYRIAARIGLRRIGRLVVVLTFLANPSLLYTFTTALTEPVLIAGLLGCAAGLARWATSPRTPSGGELAVFAGIPAAIAVMSRYEGWALLIGGTGFVLIVAVRNGKGIRGAIIAAASFVAVPAAAVIWWLAYNWGTYHDAFEFLFGPYSAYAQQKSLYGDGLLPTKHNLGLSLSTYGWATIECTGVVLLILALAGLLILIWDSGLSNRTLIVALLAIAAVFSIVSLYLGQTVIDNDHSMPMNWWNNRFALSVCPLAAMLAGVLLDRLTRPQGSAFLIVGGLLVAVVWQNLWFAQDLYGRSAILAEAALERQSKADTVLCGNYLRAHYQGGGILMDESINDNAVLPEIGIPLSQYDIRASGASFTAALADPAAHDEWILAELPQRHPSPGAPVDLVERALARNPQATANYRIVFRTRTHALYQRIVQTP